MYNASFGNEELQNRNLKVLVLLALIFFFFTIIISRLFYLQYLHYEENLERSENNRLRRVVLTAERGFIYDRKGRILVRNRPSYQIALQSLSLPRKKSEKDSIFRRLLEIRDLNGVQLFDSASLDTAFQRTVWIKNRPIRILEDATPEEVALIEETTTEEEEGGITEEDTGISEDDDSSTEEDDSSTTGGWLAGSFARSSAAPFLFPNTS
jgi:penicillin-binding protein 2